MILYCFESSKTLQLKEQKRKKNKHLKNQNFSLKILCCQGLVGWGPICRGASLVALINKPQHEKQRRTKTGQTEKSGTSIV